MNVFLYIIWCEKYIWYKIVLIYIIRIGVVSDITFGSSLYMAAYVVNSTYKPQAHKIYLLLSCCPNHVIIMPDHSCLYSYVLLLSQWTIT
jgi:hypothetical protein